MAVTSLVLQRHMRGEGPPPSWKLNVLFSSIPPRDYRYSELFSPPNPPLARLKPHKSEAGLLGSSQAFEVLVFAAADSAGLAAQLADLRAEALHVSYGELTDLSQHLMLRISDDPADCRCRAALQVASPEQLQIRLAAAENELLPRQSPRLRLCWSRA